MNISFVTPDRITGRLSGVQDFLLRAPNLPHLANVLRILGYIQRLRVDHQRSGDLLQRAMAIHEVSEGVGIITRLLAHYCMGLSSPVDTTGSPYATVSGTTTAYQDPPPPPTARRTTTPSWPATSWG